MKPLRFDGRVAIVTGAGRGLGREYALLLAARGARVVVNDRGTETDGTGVSPVPAEETVEAIVALGGAGVANSDTVATRGGAAAVIATAMDAYGRIDILVNNAGILIPKSFTETTDADIAAHFDAHIFGTMRMSQAAWPQLQVTSGNVVNVSSHAILGSLPLAAYSSAKGAIFALTRTMALAGREPGVSVNAVLPIAATRMSAADGSGETLDDATRQMVFERLHPSAVAPVVAYLAHDTCPVSGEAFAAGSNRVARVFIGEGRGVRSGNLTPEEVAERIGEIRDVSDPHDFADLDAMLAVLMS